MPKLDDIATRIYSECFGHLDDKRFRASKTTEIRDWLATGDLSDRPGLRRLVAEWREHDADDPNLRGVGRPPAAGTRRQVRLTVTVPPEYAEWLRARGDVSAQIRRLIEQAMR